MKLEEYNCKACEACYGDIILTEIKLNGKVICYPGTQLTQKELSLLGFCQDNVRVRRYMGGKMIPYCGLEIGDRIEADDSKFSIRLEKGTIVTAAIQKRYKYKQGGMLRVSSGIRKAFTKASALSLDEKVKTRVLDGVRYIFSNNEPDKMLSAASQVTDILCDTIFESDATSIALEQLRISDDYTFKHSVDVATMAAFLGNSLGFTSDIVRALGMSGLLHDIGKTKIPSEIINKNGKLTDEERAIINEHPQYGYDICLEMPDMPVEVALGVLHHQEKYDGTGYPHNLAGQDISLFGRILAVCDVYDALVTPRSYKPGFSPLKAMSIMMEDNRNKVNNREQSIHFDNYYLAALRSCIQFFEPNQEVTLTDGRVGHVVTNNIGWPFRPVVRVGSQEIDLAHECDNIFIVGVPRAEGGVYEISTCG